MLFNLFKKKQKAYKLFGRKKTITDKSVCDVCDKEINFSDYAYLCRKCWAKLPTYAQATHHWLIEYPEARRLYLIKSIKYKAQLDNCKLDKEVD